MGGGVEGGGGGVEEGCRGRGRGAGGGRGAQGGRGAAGQAEGWRGRGGGGEWSEWRLHFGCFRFGALLRGSVRCGNGSVRSVRYCEIVLLKRP